MELREVGCRILSLLEIGMICYGFLLALGGTQR